MLVVIIAEILGELVEAGFFTGFDALTQELLGEIVSDGVRHIANMVKNVDACIPVTSEVENDSELTFAEVVTVAWIENDEAASRVSAWIRYRQTLFDQRLFLLSLALRRDPSGCLVRFQG
jgi:hypothetical protein